MFYHTSPRKASWTSKARGDRWWKLWRGSMFDEPNPLQDSPFSYSPSSCPWSSSSNPSTSPSVAPFVKWYPLTGSRAQHFLLIFLTLGLSTYPSWRFLLRLISLVNSWFWWVNSAMAVAMDCMCWMEDSCVTNADWWSWWGLLEASLLSWWPGLMALDLVRTI